MTGAFANDAGPGWWNQLMNGEYGNALRRFAYFYAAVYVR
jgi:hypothetical protein